MFIVSYNLRIERDLTVIYFNFQLRVGIPFIASPICGQASVRTFQHICHWWWKCSGSGAMVLEVSPLSVAGIRNLTQTTHMPNKHIFSSTNFWIWTRLQVFLNQGAWLLPSGSDLFLVLSLNSYNVTGMQTYDLPSPRRISNPVIRGRLSASKP